MNVNLQTYSNIDSSGSTKKATMLLFTKKCRLLVLYAIFN